MDGGKSGLKDNQAENAQNGSKGKQEYMQEYMSACATEVEHLLDNK